MVKVSRRWPVALWVTRTLRVPTLVPMPRLEKLNRNGPFRTLFLNRQPICDLPSPTVHIWRSSTYPLAASRNLWGTMEKSWRVPQQALGRWAQLEDPDGNQHGLIERVRRLVAGPGRCSGRW
jgi:hypothetical protein